ncbi:MAG: hypothetical protein ACFFB6_13840, partial [Promethearchaeota archaeon]
KTINTFIQEEKTPEKLLAKTIRESEDPLDIDKYIAEEELKLEFISQAPEGDIDNIITAFIEEKT